MKKHRGKDHINALVFIRKRIATRLPKFNGDTQSLCSRMPILKARRGDIETMYLGTGKGLLPRERVVPDGAAHIDNQLWVEIWPFESSEVCHRVTNVI